MQGKRFGEGYADRSRFASVQITHGRAAQSLDELLPACLEVIPMNDFNGQFLRYSAADKVVYAVGVDLTDSGGMPEPKRAQPVDQVFKSDF